MKLLTLTLFITASTVFAENSSTTPDPAMTMTGMKFVAQDRITELQEQVDQLITAHTARLDEEAGELLAFEQINWENWARARAKLFGDVYRGGSMAGLAYSHELTRLYRKRITQLKQLEEAMKP